MYEGDVYRAFIKYVREAASKSKIISTIDYGNDKLIICIRKIRKQQYEQ